MNKEIEKKINDVINAKTGFIPSNNYKLVEATENHCILEGIITDSSLNPYGTAHGGYIFGLADTAGGTIARMNGHNPVTSTSTVFFLHKAKGNVLTAKARLLKKGKTLTNCEVEVFDEEDNLISKVVLEYFNL